MIQARGRRGLLAAGLAMTGGQANAQVGGAPGGGAAGSSTPGTSAGSGSERGYPERGLTITVCFAPGGSTDFSARVIAQGLADSFGKPVVVENRPGAGGNIGIAAVARAAPDGYALLVASSVFVVNPSLYPNVPYDPFRDFACIATLGVSPNVICVRGDSPFRTLPDLIAAAKAQPDRFDYAHPGIGTTPMLAGEVLKLRTGIRMQHITYPGAGPAAQALLSGATEVMITSLGGAVDVALRNGQMRALAQTGEARVPALPEVPTLEELGIRDAVSVTFNALYAPAATPAPVVDTLARTALAVLARPEVRKRYADGGLEVLAEGPDLLRARVAREVPLWREIIRQAKISVE